MPARGEVWQVDLNPVRGHEQGEERPAVIVSTDKFNRSAAGLVVIVPVTRKDRGIPFHVAIDPPEGGLQSRSFALCDQVRTITTDRLLKQKGTVNPATLAAICDRLRVLLEL